MMNVNKLSINFIKSSKPNINYQSIRHLRPRKPFWLGLAKSKITKVPQRKVTRSDEENKEFYRLFYNYSTFMKSLKRFIIETDPLLQKHANKNRPIESFPFMKAEIDASLEQNEMFNARSSELRTARLKIELEEFKEKAEKLIKEAKEEEVRRKALCEKVVQLEKLKSKSFITPENLEEAIEKCLSEEVEYNYAIDIKGNKYLGKEPLSENSSDLNELNKNLEFSAERI